MLKICFTRFLAVFALCFFICGCAAIYDKGTYTSAESRSKKIILAVMPFQSPEEARDAGMAISDILANQLYAGGRYTIVTPEIVAKAMAEREGDSLSPKEAAQLVGANYILTGRVLEYTYKAGVGETPVVGVTARLIDPFTGAVLWSADRAGGGGGNWFAEDSLSHLSILLCKDLAGSLNDFLEEHPLKAHYPEASGEPSQAPAAKN